ncbi:hypothetical protein BCR44DRAFT_66364 [Catenaria anguillulae PL171]|uniref:SH3 domain-containing protein n=1 Tax=Catenaria anguillulae PL171 TaxID=765915 RepID=A0A1Y2HU56_9FUNG|nr:hypothetical protein BCR44DRAFT_66364 [Catenaria anguillulae PL171]
MAQPSQNTCVPLSGSTSCPGYPTGVSVNGNLTWAVSQIYSYFGKSAPAQPAVISSPQQFDDLVMRKLIANMPVAPLFACDIPKDHLQFFNAFICTWLVSASDKCSGNNAASTILCGPSTSAFFASAITAIESSATCPALSPQQRLDAASAVKSSISPPFLSDTPNQISNFFNGKPGTCVQAEAIQADSLCGYGSRDAACAHSCQTASCGLSTLAIIGIVAGVVVVLAAAILGLLYCKRRRATPTKPTTTSRDAQLSNSHPVPSLDVPIPSSPFVGAPVVNRVGRQSFVPPNPEPQQSLPSPTGTSGVLPTPTNFQQFESYSVLLQSARSAQSTPTPSNFSPSNGPKTSQQPPALEAAGVRTTEMDPKSAVRALQAMVGDQTSQAGSRSTMHTEPMHALQRLVSTPNVYQVPAVPPIPSSPKPSVLPDPHSVEGKVMVVSAHFEPDMNDELQVSVNDRVLVIKTFDDFWCYAGLLSPHNSVLAKGMIPLCVFEDFSTDGARSVLSGTASVVSDAPQRRMSTFFSFKA